jgi:hypothetical protein
VLHGRSDVAVSASRQRLDPACTSTTFQHLAHRGDLDSQVAVLDCQSRPGGIDQCFFAHRLAPALHEDAQDSDGTLAEFNRLTATHEKAEARIEPEGAKLVELTHRLDGIFSEILRNNFAPASRPTPLAGR